MVNKSFTKNIKGGIWYSKKKLPKIIEPRASNVDFNTAEIMEDNDRRLINQFDRELAVVKPENENNFNEYVEHEWKNCRHPDTKKLLTIDEYTQKIKTDPTYPKAHELRTEDFKKMHNHCYSEDKKSFKESLKNSRVGKFFLSPYTGGKRTKAKKNKNKKKTKTYKKCRK